MAHPAAVDDSAAELVIIETPSAATAALGVRRPSGEVNHVLTNCGDEGAQAFARRVLRRVRTVRRSGKHISGLSYAVETKRQHAQPNTRQRLISTLIGVLEPGATFTLIAFQASPADLMDWMDALRPLAKVGVSLNVVL